MSKKKPGVSAIELTSTPEGLPDAVTFQVIDIPDALKTLRQAHKFTQEFCSTRFGHGPSTWERYENGRHLPSLETLAELAQVLEYDMEILFVKKPLTGGDVIQMAANASDLHKKLEEAYEEIEANDLANDEGAYDSERK